ncbi:hypothetical protein Tco_1316098 [Tanacetum coccineum]
MLSRGVIGKRERVNSKKDGFEVEEDLKVLKEDEVVPKVEDVSLVDGVFDVALGGDGDEDFAIGEGLEWKPWRKKKKRNVMKMIKRMRRHERYLRHFDHHLHRHNERMMDDRRRRKRKQKWKDDLFLCHNPFTSFAHSEEREDT